MKAPMKVLFVEDSENDVELALRALKRDGLDVLWRRVESEAAMKQALATFVPHAIVSDFSMPQFDGLSALRLARDIVPDLPFIFLSGTIGEERAIEAIRSGATDYVLKDNIRRLGTSVKRALDESMDRRRMRKVEEERARLVEVLEATSDYVAITDPSEHIIYMNRAWRTMAGVVEQDLSDKELIDFHAAATRERILDTAWPATLERGIWSGEGLVVASDGNEIPVSQVIVGHRDDEGRLRFRSTIARDIRDRKAYEARIQYLANYDSVSGMPNRSLLGDRATQAIARAKRSGRACGAVAVSIDRFKLLNDSYGHAAGDGLLKMLAERISKAVREIDTVAHVSANVFAVLVVDLSRAEDVVAVARKVHECANTPLVVEGRSIHVSLSIGASTFPRDGEDFDVLLRNATAAMHRANETGDNSIQFYTASMTESATERIEIETALRAAIEQEQFQLHYQPQVSVEDGRLVGLEALVRWKHPERGYISPVVFVPIAEDCGQIQPLGLWVLQESCRQLNAWHRAGYRVRVAVNVSAQQFRREGFVEAVREALGAHAIDPAFFELELTESVLIEDRERAIATLQRLKGLGLQIAVDDFGTGYSSLSYLSGLPVDRLKIDRSFVVQTGTGGRDAAIAQAIVSLGHTLGLQVLAEGVETTEQLHFLRQHRCDECQGYLFARPRPPDALLGVLNAGALEPAS